ncbi:hypothetical protein ACLKA7_003000 [Drosophila subpalustris]
MLQRRLENQKQRRHRRQQLERIGSSRKANYLPGLLIVLLVLLQNFELHMCRQLMRRSGNSLLKDSNENSPRTMEEQEELARGEKRGVAETSVGQPEEIFSAPNDGPDMSYDEYPMVVPKRAALLLDRLMVALHHALENERDGHRIGDFYANKNLIQMKPIEYKNGFEQLQPTEEGVNMPSNSNSFHMYSDDDPSAGLLDYDFKDINQINRATGETRRAGGVNTALMGNMDAATSTPGGSTAAAGAGPGPGGRRIHHVANGGGRMYWRCYFNAVSCF